jgi:hypothetical protein
MPSPLPSAAAEAREDYPPTYGSLMGALLPSLWSRLSETRHWRGRIIRQTDSRGSQATTAEKQFQLANYGVHVRVVAAAWHRADEKLELGLRYHDDTIRTLQSYVDGEK